MAKKIPVNRFATVAQQILLGTAPYWGNYVWWHRIWKFSDTHFHNFFTASKFYNRKIITNYGNLSLLVPRLVPTFNNPLIELVYQLFQYKKRPLNFIDVGAAIGDTVLLCEANCPKMINFYICIDGDKDFFALLEYNFSVAQAKGILINSLLSDKKGCTMPALVKHHSGSATAIGENVESTTTIDDVLATNEGLFNKNIDLIKIDADGFDGLIISGARNILAKDKPTVIFEWHPILYARTDNDVLLPFKILQSLGYKRYIWFNKYGNFSHFTTLLDEDAVTALQKYALDNVGHDDWHYDIIALPDSCPLSATSIAALQYANRKKYPY
ncbi:MAG: FkbM family methyltransferase [Saprospiraceae bacterium]|nr:FkbM family methyltransferase [Saprospiraceae bacterium]MBP7699441.1 FkbM family methyltransferase [Saprospiraceae bacterium]